MTRADLFLIGLEKAYWSRRLERRRLLRHAEEEALTKVSNESIKRLRTRRRNRLSS